MGTRKVARLRGSWLVSSRAWNRASSLATAMLSEHHKAPSGSRVRNPDRIRSNIDALFKKHTYLTFPSKTIYTDGIRAGVMVRSVGQLLLNAD